MNVASELIGFSVGAVSFIVATLVASGGKITPMREPNTPTPLPVAWWLLIILVTIVTALIYGEREVYGDTEVYHQNFSILKELGYTPDKAWLFSALAWLLLLFSSEETTLTLITMLVCFGVSLGIARYMKDYAGSLAANAVMFTSFYCLGIQSNVLSQGLAIALLLIFLPELLHAQKSFLAVAKVALICYLASGFHMSVILIFAPSLLVAHLLRFKVKVAIAIAVGATVFSVFGGGIEQLPFLGNVLSGSASFYASYLDSVKDDRYYRVGFRTDFTVFVWFYALWGIYVWGNKKLRDPWYEKILVMYLLCMSIFICSFNIPFSDRIGLYCFVLIPMIVCYPLGRIKSFATADARLLFNLYVVVNFLFTFFYFGSYWFKFV